MRNFGVCVLFGTLFLASQALAQVDLNQGLVAYYPFNGNVNDESGYGNHGEVYGAILTEDRFGNLGSAYSFDGIDDYIEIPDSQYNRMLESFSISFWVNNPITSEKQETLVQKSGSNLNSNNYQMFFEGPHPHGVNFHFENPSDRDYGVFVEGHPGCNAPNTSYDCKDTTTIENHWNNIAFTKLGDTFQFFINGRLINNATWSFTESVGNYSLYLGKDASVLLDDVRIYQRALTQLEVQEIYNQSNPSVITPNTLEQSVTDLSGRWTYSGSNGQCILVQHSDILTGACNWQQSTNPPHYTVNGNIFGDSLKLEYYYNDENCYGNVEGVIHSSNSFTITSESSGCSSGWMQEFTRSSRLHW